MTTLISVDGGPENQIDSQAGTRVAQFSFFGNQGVQDAPMSVKRAAVAQADKGVKALRTASSTHASRPAEEAPPKPALTPVPLSKASGDDSTWQEF